MIKILFIALLWMNDGTVQTQTALFDEPKQCIEAVELVTKAPPKALGFDAAQIKAGCIAVEFDEAQGKPPIKA